MNRRQLLKCALGAVAALPLAMVKLPSRPPSDTKQRAEERAAQIALKQISLSEVRQLEDRASYYAPAAHSTWLRPRR